MRDHGIAAPLACRAQGAFLQKEAERSDSGVASLWDDEREAFENPLFTHLASVLVWKLFYQKAIRCHIFREDTDQAGAPLTAWTMGTVAPRRGVAWME